MLSQTSCAVSPCVRAIMKKEEIEFRKKRLNFACLIVPFFYEFVFEVKNDATQKKEALKARGEQSQAQ